MTARLLTLFLLLAPPPPAVRLEYRLKPNDASAWKFEWRETVTVTPIAGAARVSSLHIEGTLIQRVLSVEKDGSLYLALESSLDSMRLVLEGKAVARTERPREIAFVRIDRFGKILQLEVENRSTSPGQHALESLRGLALVQFPNRELRAGESWEPASARGPKITAQLVSVEEEQGRPLARMKLHTEAGLRAGGKQPMTMRGRLVIDAEQTVDANTGMTVQASSTAVTEMESGTPPTRQSTRVQLSLVPTTVPSATAPSTPPATPSPSLPPLKLKSDELKLSGVLVGMTESELTLRVESFTNARGRTAAVVPPRSRRISLTSKTELNQLGVRGQVNTDVLALGQRIAVIGRDPGAGRVFPARRIDIETPFSPFGPPGPGKQKM